MVGRRAAGRAGRRAACCSVVVKASGIEGRPDADSQARPESLFIPEYEPTTTRRGRLGTCRAQPLGQSPAPGTERRTASPRTDRITLFVAPQRWRPASGSTSTACTSTGRASPCRSSARRAAPGPTSRCTRHRARRRLRDLDPDHAAPARRSSGCFDDDGRTGPRTWSRSRSADPATPRRGMRRGARAR